MYSLVFYESKSRTYLTVTVYKIIDEVYKAIGRPIDTINQLLDNCDEKVWKVYAEGLTTTINQSDSNFGKQTLRRYKPKNLAEMSAWVASIRPGFASLLDNFLDRKPYTTGVKELDEILEDSFHYLLYQESIMKYLVWLGIEEKGTYDIIKKISKKKFKEEELEELKGKLKVGWMKRVGKEEGFEKTWQVVMDAAHYSFNASHSLSVAIDSLYGAYLKSHYPLEYFTVALNYNSGNQDTTVNLTEELTKFGVKMSDIKFGKSKANYSYDKETNSIFKGIGSIKFINEIIPEQLYNLSKNKYNNFLELLKDIKEQTDCNSKQIDILIRLDFFSEFGKQKLLLKCCEMLDKFKNGNAKQIDKKSVEDDNIMSSIISRNSTHTEKLYKIIDCNAIMKELYSYYKTIYDEDLPVSEKIECQIEYMGYVDIRSDKPEDRLKLIVTDIKPLKAKKTGKVWTYITTCTSLFTGKTKELLINSKIFDKLPLKKYSIINTYPNAYEKSIYNGRENWHLLGYQILPE